MRLLLLVPLAFKALRRNVMRTAIVLGVAGGLIGVGLGMAGTRTIADVFQWPTRLDPIEARRHE